ncbi:MAG: septum site-determining protein MinC [Fusobacteriaceae bacterium]
MNEIIVLKFKNQRLTFILDNNLEFKLLQKEFVKKILEIENLVKSSKIEVEFKGRKLLEKEKNKLVVALKRATSIEITYLYYNQEENIESEEEIEIVEKIEDFSMEEGVTKFHWGTLRSGAVIRFEGHVVIFGDINPGAIVEAKGNVVVIGKISGIVQAGKSGDEKAIIAGKAFNPIQLRIASHIAKHPEQGIIANKKVDKTIGFEVAYIKNEQIMIDFVDKNFSF